MSLNVKFTSRYITIVLTMLLKLCHCRNIYAGPNFKSLILLISLHWVQNVITWSDTDTYDKAYTNTDNSLLLEFGVATFGSRLYCLVVYFVIKICLLSCRQTFVAELHYFVICGLILCQEWKGFDNSYIKENDIFTNKIIIIVLKK